MTIKNTLGAVVLSAIVLPGLAFAQAHYPDRFTLSTGVDYSNGDYGSVQDTEIWYAPLTGKYEVENWVFRLTVPYIRITGPRGAVVGGTEGPIVVRGDTQARTTEEGLGDIVGAATYSFFPTSPEMPLVEFTGKVKFPTADDADGLGTGEFDYTLQTDISKTYGRLTPFGTLGYRFLGDPNGFDLDDVFFLSAGFDYKLAEPWSAGLIYDYRTASSDFADDGNELAPYVSYRVADWTFTGYGIVGFTDGSPDEGAGLQVSRAFTL